ncbi:hypothetical protein BDF19DRAFT_421374 [Syncephalis fuscata]|nr:hypothetical protein BDF19DRAFT_421374 [Syncephalis fuscata]
MSCAGHGSLSYYHCFSRYIRCLFGVTSLYILLGLLSLLALLPYSHAAAPPMIISSRFSGQQQQHNYLLPRQLVQPDDVTVSRPSMPTTSPSLPKSSKTPTPTATTPMPSKSSNPDNSIPTAAIAVIRKDGIEAVVTFRMINMAGIVLHPDKIRVQNKFSPISNEIPSNARNSSNALNTTQISSADNFLFGLMIDVDINSGLREQKADDGYAIHVHENPIADDGDCGSTGAHLNYEKVDATGCYASSAPMFDDKHEDNCQCRLNAPIRKCESGNLSGKWGLIRADPASLEGAALPVRWYDPTLTIIGAPGVLGRSVALHWPNRTMMTCANIYSMDENGQAIISSVESNDSSALSSSTARVIAYLAGLLALMIFY